MLQNIAENLHSRMKNNNVDAPSIAVIVYALQILTNTLSIIGISLLVGFVTGEFMRTLMLLAVFAMIRYLSGGYHLKSGLWCIIVSSLAMSIIPHIHLDNHWTYGLTGIALIAMLLFAPANYDKYARISEKYYKYLKIISAAIVALNFILVSDVLALAFFAQSLLLPFKEGGDGK